MRIHHLLICDQLIYDLLIHHVLIYYPLIYHLLIHHPLLYYLLIHHLLIYILLIHHLLDHHPLLYHLFIYHLLIHHLFICHLLIYHLLTVHFTIVINKFSLFSTFYCALLMYSPVYWKLFPPQSKACKHLCCMTTMPCAATNREAVSGWANKQYLPTCSHNGWANSHCVDIIHSANIYAIGRNKLMCDMSIGVTVIWVILCQINQCSRSQCLRFDIYSPIYSLLLLLMLNDACVVCQGQVWRGGAVAQERPPSTAFSTSTAEF